MYKALITISIFNASLQADVIPESLIGIFSQLPFVGVLIWLGLLMDKRQREDKEKDRLWLEHMLKQQREEMREIYQSSNAILSTLVNQMKVAQIDILNELKLLSQQVAVNTATVNEVAKVDSMITELMDRLERK